MLSFIVAGPMSSGNRLMASILVRAGLNGNGSTNQPKEPEDIDYSQPSVIIKHSNLDKWLDAYEAHGHEVAMLVMVREPHAHAISAYNRGHYESANAAYRSAPEMVMNNLVDAVVHGCKVEIIPYESLCDDMVLRLLERHGLPTDTMSQPLVLDGQDISNYIDNQDFKHYENNLAT